jgi:ketosteroid isomerase-like protein
MKSITLLALATLVAVVGGQGLPSATSHAADEQAIRQLNEECLKAHDTGDIATLDRIEDTDFTLSGDFGVIHKQQHLEHDRQQSNKPSQVISRKIDPQVFRFYGDIALVTETDRPTTKDGTFAFQSTEVWVRRSDSWKLVHLHFSQLEQKR